MAYATGIAFGVTRTRAVITDVHGRVLCELEDNPLVLSSIEELPSGILSTYDRLIHSTSLPRDKMVALGVSLGGFMDDKEGTVSILGLPHTVEGTQFLWSEGTGKSMPLAQNLAGLSGLNVAVEDRPRAAAFAEKRFGVTRESDHFIFLRVGSQDVSAGLFLDGRLYRGHRGVSGEVGHLVLSPDDGPLCRCGNRGCLEVLSSGRALVQAVLAGIRGGINSSLLLTSNPNSGELTAEKVVEAAKAGDKLCWQVVYDAARYLGEAAAILVNLFGPEMLVLGGLAESSGGLFLHQVSDAVRLRALDVMSRNVRVVESSLGPWGPARGAAALALEKAFSSGGCLDKLLEESPSRC
jgi:predicted NBD/HSP70 family sugar kinase